MKHNDKPDQSWRDKDSSDYDKDLSKLVDKAQELAPPRKGRQK